MFAAMAIGLTVLLLVGLLATMQIHWFVAWIAAWSTTAFLLYGFDKGQAGVARLRIPEVVLQGVGLLGGAAGALLAMLVFRHKTRHSTFWIVQGVGLVLHLGLLWWLL